MKLVRTLALSGALVLAVAACGSDESATTTTVTTASTTTTEGSTTSQATTSEAPSTTEGTTTTAPVGLEQPAIWPASSVVFTTPEEAAADFVSNVLGVPPQLGVFMQGDSRSGEIEVLSLPEGGDGEGVPRSLLLMRQLGPSDGWFVLAAINEFNTITAPESAALVAPGPIDVSGTGRGFEATVVVQAFIVELGTEVDMQVTQGGSFADPEPYEVTLDLSGAEVGDTVILLVKGGVGLETDPGDFSAIPVVIGP